MKSSRFQFEYRESASKLHQAIGECLRNSSIFSSYRIYQEYPVNKINPKYIYSNHHFDWVILDIQLVIEGMGKQHYCPTNFGSLEAEAVEENFCQQQIRDSIKKDAAISSGFTYIVIPYYDLNKITDIYIYNLYQQNFNSNIEKKLILVKNKLTQEQKSILKERNKKRYHKQKEWLKQKCNTK